MPKYRKKPVEVHAIQVSEYIAMNFADFNGIGTYTAQDGKLRKIRLRDGGASLAIETLEGVMIADPNDFIITGVWGEKYPCKPEIFAETYELAEE